MSRADPLRIADYLQNILEAIDNIRDYTAGMDLAAFTVDRKTRNALSHGYFTVDHTIVWQTIQQDLPGLRARIASLS